MKDSITMEYFISLKFFTVKISATRSDDESTDAAGHSGGELRGDIAPYFFPHPFI